MEKNNDNYPKYENMEDTQEDIYFDLPNLVVQSDISTYNQPGLIENTDNNGIKEEVSPIDDFELETLIRSATAEDDENIINEYNEIVEKNQTDKYDNYNKILDIMKDGRLIDENINESGVMDIINKLRRDYAQKIFKCSICSKILSLDVAFIYKETNKKICRECAVEKRITRKNPNTNKKQLIDFSEEERNKDYYIKCKRCKAYRVMNQFKMEVTNKKIHITQCKFCSNLKFLYDNLKNKNGRIKSLHRRYR